MKAYLVLFSVFFLQACSAIPLAAFKSDFEYRKELAASTLIPAADIESYPFVSQYMSQDGASLLRQNMVSDLQGVSTYVNGFRQITQQSDGRIIRTIGFETDVYFVSQPPSPRAALSSRRPVCWESLWKATGSRPATNYVLSGCLSVYGSDRPRLLDGTRPKDPLYRVDEHVKLGMLGLSYRNSWWFDPVTKNIVLSRQQMGPLLPVIELQQVTLDAPSRRYLRQGQLPFSGGPVQLSVSGIERGQYQIAANLISVTGRYMDRHDIDWNASRLFDVSADVVSKLEETRASVLAKLVAMQQRLDIEPSQRLELNIMQREIEALRLAKHINAPLNPFLAYVDQQKNLRLMGDNYHLVLAKSFEGVPLRGAIYRHEFIASRDRFRQQGIDPKFFMSIADSSNATVLYSDGRSFEAKLKNADDYLMRELPVGGLVFVPIQRWLSQLASKDLNAQIESLYWNSLP